MEPLDRLKKAREYLGKPQNEMANMLGINYRTYQNYETGRNDLGWDALKALTVLGFNANWILTGEGEMRRGETGTGQTQSQTQSAVNTGGSVHQTATGHHDSDISTNYSHQVPRAIKPELVELVELLDRYAGKAMLEDIKGKLLNIKKVMEG